MQQFLAADEPSAEPDFDAHVRPAGRDSSHSAFDSGDESEEGFRAAAPKTAQKRRFAFLDSEEQEGGLDGSPGRHQEATIASGAAQCNLNLQRKRSFDALEHFWTPGGNSERR